MALLCIYSHVRASGLPFEISTYVLKAAVITIKLWFGLLVPGSALVLCFHLLRETELKTAFKVWSGPTDLGWKPGSDTAVRI